MEREELRQAELDAYDLIWAMIDVDAETEEIKQAMRDWAALDERLREARDE